MTNTLDGYTLGFIGLGLMGRPMCLNLHRAGARMVVHNRSSFGEDGIESFTGEITILRPDGRSIDSIKLPTTISTIRPISSSEDSAAVGFWRSL